METKTIKQSLFAGTTPQKEEVSKKKEVKELTQKEFEKVLVGFLTDTWSLTGNVMTIGKPEKVEMSLKSGEKKMYWSCMVAKQHTKISQYTPRDMKVGDEEKRRALCVFNTWGKPTITLSWDREPIDRSVYHKAQ